MIESIQIASTATFENTPESLTTLSKFNYIFGANGSGKTTISRIIADTTKFPNCAINWKNTTKLQTLVYNRDFVEKNFNQSTELKGIFTLGEKNVEIIKRISTLKTELDDVTKKIQNLNKNLKGDDGSGGKMGELSTLEEELKNKCWEQKKKHDAKLYSAFEGFRNSAEKFKGKIIQELSSNSAILDTLDNLEEKALTVFGSTPEKEATVPTVISDDLITHESNSILGKKVIGKEDVDISAMIQKLGNSDWVRQGRSFYEVNDKTCPFCQQSTTDSFAKSLNDYFDETFENDSKAINNLDNNYKTDAVRVQQQIASIINNKNRFLDTERLNTEKELLDSKITTNLQRLSEKKKEPSQTVDLESVTNVMSQIKSIIDSANAQITSYNLMVANITQERLNLTAQIWKYLIETELKVDLTTYKTKQDNIQKSINSITAQISSSEKEKLTKENEIQELEKQTTSIQPTINAINPLLASFGFQGFSIAKADNGQYYKLVRADGTDAKETLSEGEKTFITFLYFYHLLKGSNTESGITTDRVVVFDDPVSSLDSDILFIVSSLIKGLFDEVRTGAGYIKQIFVLTHNVYFHKEITFNQNRQDKAMNEETFWVIHKHIIGSKIEQHTSNPIKTSYELLWAEIRKPNPSNLTIQNTMRRILENYFKILGGVDPYKICELFEGKEKLICKSLFSWVNDGSHNAHDDLYVSSTDSVVNVYLKVFKSIFEKTEHTAHYNMMMGEVFRDEKTKEGTTV